MRNQTWLTIIQFISLFNMGKIILNDAYKIVFVDKNGEKKPAKEIWFRGKYNKYKIWPGVTYVDNIEIVEWNGGPSKVFTYNITSNGIPSYTYNNKTYYGLSPSKKYAIRGVLHYMEYKNGNNTETKTAYDCYFEHLTTTNQSNPNVWSVDQSQTRENPVTKENDKIGLYSCNSDYVSDNENLYYTPHMIFIPKWPGTGSYVTVSQMEGDVDLGIRLKRAQRKSTFTVPPPSKTTFEYKESGSLDETTISGIYYVTYWDGPDRLERTRSWSVSSSHANILRVEKGDSHVTIKCIKAPALDTDVTVTFTPESIQGYSASSKTFTFTVKGVKYRATLNGYTVYSGLEYNVPLTETSTITVERSFDDGVTWSQFYPTLSAGSQIVTISNNGSVVPQSEGTTTIYITVDGKNVMSIPITIDLPDEPASCYVTVTVYNTSGNYSTLLNREYISENIIKTARISNSSWNNISIQFHAASTGNVQQTVYWTKSGSVSNWSGVYDGSGSSISMYKNSNGGTGTLTLTLGSKSGQSNLGKLELIFQ